MTDVLLLRGLSATDHLYSFSKFANFDLYSYLFGSSWVEKCVAARPITDAPSLCLKSPLFEVLSLIWQPTIIAA